MISKNRLNYHRDATVNVAATAQVKESSIKVATEGELTIGDHTYIEDCDFNIAPGAIVKIDCHCKLKGVVLRVRRQGATFILGEYSVINNRSNIFADCLIKIGRYVLIAADCFLTDSQIHSIHWQDRREEIKQSRQAKLVEQFIKTASVTIGDDCWLGKNSQVHLPKNGGKELILGRGTIVGAGAIVKESFLKPFTKIAGVPAKFIGDIDGTDYIDRWYEKI